MTDNHAKVKALLSYDLRVEERLHLHIRHSPTFDVLFEQNNAHQDRLRDALAGIVQSMNDQQEQYILRVFGSEEVAQELLPLFELEEHPVEIDIVSDDGNHVVLKTTQQFRLKLKETEQ